MIAREELFFCQRASHSARERTPEDQRKDIVEPDHSCGPGPYEIMNDTVVAVGNPTILRERLRNEVAKLFGRPRGPVRLPVESIKLNVRKTQHAGERAGESGLAGTAGANHNHARRLALHTTREFT